MPSPIISLRLPAPLYAALLAFCAEHRQIPSMVARAALRDLLTHPERWPDLLEARLVQPLDAQGDVFRTWEQAVEGAEGVDMGEIIAAMRVEQV
jgi:hypothetical protein